MNEVLTEKLSSLKEVGVSSEICSHISGMIETSMPSNLMLISPFRKADEWKLDQDEVLNAFLYSTKLGIFDLEWEG